jgi:hypothetical protein
VTPPVLETTANTGQEARGRAREGPSTSRPRTSDARCQASPPTTLARGGFLDTLMTKYRVCRNW